MTHKYDDLDRDALIRLLKRRDAERQLGLVWERDEIDADAAVNNDYVALELDAELSHGAAPWDNLIIEGDNFDALRALRASHKGAIRCIYIDPPYNTGNRDFVYNDRFVDKTHRFRHSLWLEFMYRRLQLAKDLLADDGVIFVSIDDNELFRLGMLMDRVFGHDGHVATCIWQKRYSRENREAIGDAHEYLLVFAINPEKFKEARGRIPLTQDQAKIYRNPNDDPKGRWRGIPMTAQGFRPNQMYEIKGPDGRTHTPPEGRCWSTVESEFEKLRENGRIYFGKDGTAQPSVIRYLSEVEGLVPWTWWPHEEVGHTDEARKEIQSIFGTQTAFDTPKPVRLMERVLRISMKPGDIALDFFAGSGTTAHAVAKLNAEDGGNRKFILVSSTEATEDNPGKNLCRDVCAERVRRVLGGYTNAKGEAVAGLGGGFAYLRARRIPKHRLSLKLDHPEIWNALQLLHGHPLTPWQDGGFAVDEADDGSAIAYLADAYPASKTRMDEWLAQRGTQAATVYSWAPERYRTTDSPHDWRPIPQHLRERFGR
ncbi:site-specific DNA-methyltransferase [Pseudoxanthomonas kalamensis DSM 18571]|uniref:site-specific DNA-methyltransferase n=1 Tax=Pseudoxanthomonas kalamensis TaxID=289483 RepID=UPI0013914A83|nr:site-specific DNA-methyltransferase [Pseudoxanthomonas kalamensis]KAF1712187.1 site-specific DNA-methyltransferase [Pseudoxanthomonas kalamensis DSM 18571]